MRNRGTFSIFENLAIWHILIIAAVGAILVGLVTAYVWPSTFQAYSSFLLPDSEQVATANVQSTGAGQADPQQVQDRLWTVVTSRALRKRLVEKHNLAEKFGVDKAYAVDMLEWMTQVDTIGGGGLKIIVTVTGSGQIPLGLGQPLTKEEARELCATLANSYVEELDEFMRQNNVRVARRRRELLQESKQEVEVQLDETEQRLQVLQERFDLIDPDSKAQRVVQRILSIQDNHDTVSAQVDDLSQSLQEARGELSDVQARRIASQAKQRNPVIGSLESRMADLQVDLATEMASGKTANNRDVRQIQTAIDNIKEQLSAVEDEVLKEVSEQANPAHDEIISKVVELEVSLAGTRARMAKQNAQLAEARSQLSQLPAVARDYATIKREQKVQSDLLTSLTESLAQARLQEEMARSAEIFTTLDTADPPARRVSPTTWLASLIAFIVLFVGLGMFLVDKRLFGMYG